MRSRLAAIIAAVYLLPGGCLIASVYSCGGAFCDLGALFYSTLPIPFLKVFYWVAAAAQGVSWWEPAWPMPGAIFCGGSLVSNAVTIYLVVAWFQKRRRRRIVPMRTSAD